MSQRMCKPLRHRRYRAAGLLLLTAALVIVWPGVLGPLARAYVRFCAHYLADSPVVHHSPPYLIAVLIPIVFATLLTVALLLIRQVVGQSQLVANSNRGCKPADPQIATLANALGLSERLVVRDDLGAAVFCAGLVYPKVYLGGRLLTMLTPAELEAVLRHEAHHLQRRDPLRLFIVHILGVLTSPFPVCRTLIERVQARIEVAADQAALKSVPLETLASALVKVARVAGPASMPTTVAGLTPTEARIAALLGRSVTPSFDRHDVMISMVVLISLVGSLAQLASLSFPMTPLCDVCPPL